MQLFDMYGLYLIQTCKSKSNKANFVFLKQENELEKKRKEILELIEATKSKCTKRKTQGDIEMFRDYLKNENEEREIEKIPIRELDILISNYLMSIRKKDGDEYQPVSLQSKFASIIR